MSPREKLVQDFVNQTSEMLSDLRERILLLKSQPDNPDVLNEMFRHLHTIKGNTFFLGLNTIKAIAHELENLLGEARLKSLHLDQTFMGFLDQGFDLLGEQVDKIKCGSCVASLTDQEKEFVTALQERLMAVKVCEEPGKTPRSPKAAVQYLYGQEDITDLLLSVQEFLEQARRMTLSPDRLIQFTLDMKSLLRIFENQKDFDHAGYVKKMISDYESLVEDSGQLNEYLLALLEEEFKKILAHVIKKESTPQETHHPAMDFTALRAKLNYRIEEAKIDQIFQVVQDLDSLGRTMHQIQEDLTREAVPPEIRKQMETSLSALDFLRKDLSNKVTNLKVGPTAPLFEKMEHLILILAHACHKKVILKTVCVLKEMDWQILEILDEVVPHILRNCMDHGIEAPEERQKLGKAAQGNIQMEMAEKDGALCLTLSDDGRGIDFEGIRETALRMGKISAEEAKRLTDEQSARLLFMPGVTTSKTISDISGRGVGLDVVENRIRRLGGEIRVISRPKQGTSFEIVFPEKIRMMERTARHGG